MEFTDLPKSFRDYWNQLCHDDQRKVITCLGMNLRPIKFTLKVPANKDDLIRVVTYLKKHNIEYDAALEGAKVVFKFNTQGLRNEVMIGILTI